MTISVFFKPSFVRQLSSLESGLQKEALEKIELFRNSKNHKLLKAHRLKGRLKGRHSFSVNYKTRIVFMYIAKSKKEAVLLAIGDHDIYK